VTKFSHTYLLKSLHSTQIKNAAKRPPYVTYFVLRFILLCVSWSVDWRYSERIGENIRLWGNSAYSNLHVWERNSCFSSRSIIWMTKRRTETWEEDFRIPYKILVWKLEGNRQVEGPRLRLKYNIKTGINYLYELPCRLNKFKLLCISILINSLEQDFMISW
jgi:hypothetical protein